MSVLVITKVNADPTVMAKVVAENGDVLRGISAEARSRGAEQHLFADDGEGHVLIVDVWDRREHFEEFFGSHAEIHRLMGEAGVHDAPTTTTYQVIDGPDRF